jgi:hypothetical protein
VGDWGLLLETIVVPDGVVDDDELEVVLLRNAFHPSFPRK